MLDRRLQFHADVQERCHTRKGKIDDVMADSCEILFNLKSIKLKFHVPCDQHSTAQELMPT